MNIRTLTTLLFTPLSLIVLSYMLFAEKYLHVFDHTEIKIIVFASLILSAFVIAALSTFLSNQSRLKDIAAFAIFVFSFQILAASYTGYYSNCNEWGCIGANFMAAMLFTIIAFVISLVTYRRLADSNDQTLDRIQFVFSWVALGLIALALIALLVYTADKPSCGTKYNTHIIVATDDIGCITEKAKNEQNQLLCFELAGLQRDRCLIEQTPKDQNLCNRIDSDTYKELCFYSLAIETGNEDLCEAAGEDHRIGCIVKISKNHLDCYRYESTTKQGACLYGFVVEYNRTDLCSDMPHVQYRDQCLKWLNNTQ